MRVRALPLTPPPPSASVSKDAADAAASSSGDADSKSSTAFIRGEDAGACRRRSSSFVAVEWTPPSNCTDAWTSTAPPTGGGRVTGGAPSAFPDSMRSLNALASAFIPGLIASISSMQFFTSARYAAYRALCPAAPRSLCLPMVSTTREQKAMRTRKSSWWLPSSL